MAKKHFLEIESLRVIAAFLVAAYHIWFNQVSGGVDVFFVIAAFLLTNSFLGKEKLGYKTIGLYYVSTLRRVAANMAVIISFSIFLIYIFLPSLDWAGEIKHAFASILFVENWYLSYSGIDYLKSDDNKSAFQHFWALSLQMQFYFILPLLISLGGYLANKIDKANKLNVQLVLFSSFAIASFFYSVFITYHLPNWAYFDSIARAWQFLLGAILAILIRAKRINFKSNRAMSTIAMLVLFFFGSVSYLAPLPGFYSIIPTFSAAIIIVCSVQDANLKILKNHLLSQLGKYSFGFYLWHWPILVLYKSYFDVQVVAGLAGVVIICLSAILAVILYHLFEQPSKRLIDRQESHIRRFGNVVFLLLVPVLSTSLIAYNYSELSSDALKHSNSNNINSLVPAPIIAHLDRSSAYEDGCQQKQHIDSVIYCRHGDNPGGTTILLVGGSHATQFLDVLKVIAAESNYNLISATKSSCMLSKGNDSSAITSSCLNWNAEVLQWIEKNKPNLVITNASRGGLRNGVRGKDYVPKGYVKAFAQVSRSGVTLLGIRDNPWFLKSVPRCIQLYSESSSKCSREKSSVYSDDFFSSYGDLVNIHLVDFSNEYCSLDKCPPIKNNILMYRDSHHLTTTFTFTLKDRLKREIAVALRQ